MPGLWELPALQGNAVPQEALRMTVRHAIMQVNYYVRIRTVFEDDVDAMTLAGGERRWVPLHEAAGMALTGLARKVLARAHLLEAAPIGSSVPNQKFVEEKRKATADPSTAVAAATSAQDDSAI